MENLFIVAEIIISASTILDLCGEVIGSGFWCPGLVSHVTTQNKTGTWRQNKWRQQRQSIIKRENIEYKNKLHRIEGTLAYTKAYIFFIKVLKMLYHGFNLKKSFLSAPFTYFVRCECMLLNWVPKYNFYKNSKQFY